MSSIMPTSLDLSTLAAICQENDIESLGVFGSYSRGDFTAKSDVDLLVRFSKTKSLLDLVRIERQFSERLGKTVDLVTEASVSPYLRDRIFNEVKKLYEKSR
jgi:predicted nucleotidyltransferase